MLKSQHVYAASILCALLCVLVLVSGCQVDNELQGFLGRGSSAGLTITSPTVTEGVAGQFDITLAKAMSTDVVISYVSADGTAEDANDYTALTGDVTILAGSTVGSVVIAAPTADGVYEGSENFIVTFTVPSELSLANNDRTVTVADSDPTPTLEFTSGADSLSEASGPHTITATLSGPAQYPTTVQYFLGAGSATQGSSGAWDYTLAAATLTFPGMDTSEDISIPLNADSLPELDETVIVNLATPVGAVLGLVDEHTLTILDDDLLPFTWTGKSGIDSNWSTASNWSSNSVPGNLDIAKFNSVCLTISNTCAVTMDAAVDVAGIDMQLGYTGTITQGAVTVNVGASDFKIAAGNFVGSGFAALIISDAALVASYLQTGGTFTAGSFQNIYVEGNWSHTAGTFNAGTSDVIFAGALNSSISTAGMEFNDLTVEKTGTAILTNSTTTVVRGNFLHNQLPAAAGWQLNGPGAFEVWGNIVADDLGGFGSGDAWIKLVGNSAQDVFDISTAGFTNIEIASTGTVTLNGSIALLGIKFTSAGSLVTTGSNLLFMSGGLDSTIDMGAQSLESVQFMKASARDVLITGTLALTGNLIIDNSGAGVNEVNGGTIAVAGNATILSGDGGTTAITLTGGVDQTITTTAGTWPIGTVTLNKTAGRIIQSGNMVLEAAQDIVFQAAGTWDLNNFNLTADILNGTAAAGTFYEDCGNLTRNGTLGTINEYSGTYGVGLSVANAANVNENDATDVDQVFTVSLSVQNCEATTFDYETVAGTATAPADYTAVSPAVSTNIPANTSSVDFTIVTKFDDIAEGNENYTLQVSNLAAGVVATDLIGQGVIVDDDVLPTVSIADINVIEGANAIFVVTLSNPSSMNVVFDWATGFAGDTATANVDYTTSGQTGVTIAAGQTVYTLPAITTANDGPGDPNEFFTVTLSNVTNYTSAGSDLQATATLTEINNSGPYPDMTGIRGYWRLDESSGTFADSSGLGRTGTQSGGVVYSEFGQLQTAVRLDGVDDYIDIGSNSNILQNVNEVTLMAWVKISAYGAGTYEIISISRNGSAVQSRATLEILSDGRINVGFRDTDTATIRQAYTDPNMVATDNEWHLLAATANFTTDTIAIYYDGQPQSITKTGTALSGPTPNTTSDRTALGAEDDGSTYSLNGGLDEVTVWGRALTATDIADIYRVHTLGLSDPTDLLGMWKLDETSTSNGTAVLDSSYNANDMTMITDNGATNKSVVAQRNYGLNHDGNVDYARIANDADFDLPAGADFTMNIWIKSPVGALANCGGSCEIFSSTNSPSTDRYILEYTGANGRPEFYVSDSNNVTSSAEYAGSDVRDGQWHMLTGIKSGNNIYLYLDGVQVQTNTAAFSGTFNNAALDIGYQVGGGGSEFIGQTDDAALLGRAMSAAEVLDTYNRQKLKVIYRSIGPGNTAALAVGTGNNLTIAGGVATFASALPANVGVGDAIEYDANNNSAIDPTEIAFIHSRNSNTEYVIRTAAGEVPANMAIADQDWKICRAYNDTDSIGGGENAACIDDDVENFDLFTYPYNLARYNEQRHFALYADGAGVIMTSPQWITNATGYVRVFAPYLTSDVGVSQRHSGVWDDTKARIITNLGFEAVGTDSSHFKIDGLQLKSDSGGHCVFVKSSSALSGLIEISNNICWVDADNTGFRLEANVDKKIWNNIVYATGANNNSGLMMDGPGTTHIYNNTIIGFNYGLFSFAGTHILKNNIVQGSATYDYPGGLDGSSTNNISSDATSPNATLRNKTVLFLDSANEDFRLSSIDVEARNMGVDLSLDSNLAQPNDIAGAARGGGGAWDIGAHEAATAIYRSVGAAYTAALATGAGNNLTISGGVATFANPLMDHIGVGDAIEYDANNSGAIDAGEIAFIHGRNSASQFILRTVSGAAPADMGTADNDWKICRAYTSLANAESGNENTVCLDNDVENFDTWSSGRNLVTSGEQWHIAMYGSLSTSADGGLTIDGWTTSKDNYLRIFAPYALNQVGYTQRHKGILSKTYAMIEVTADAPMIRILDDYVRIEGLQLYHNYQFSIAEALGDMNQPVGSAGEFQVEGNLIVSRRGTNGEGYGIAFSMKDGYAYKIWNNIVSGYSKSTGLQDGSCLYLNANLGAVASTAYVYNNTFYGCGTGLNAWGAVHTVNAVNNLSLNCGASGACFTFPTNFSSVTNAGSDTSGTIDNAIVTLNDVTLNDFRLLANDTGAKNIGTDLSADPNLDANIDVLINTRGADGAWDIGALEAPTEIFRSVGPGNVSALVTGAGNNLTIASGVATFVINIPNNVGVGDAIQYDNDGNGSIDSIVFIHGRNSATSYIVRTSTGSIPADLAAADQDWSIYRAYASMANIYGFPYENNGIADSVENFAGSAEPNLVSGNFILNAALYGDAADTWFVGLGYNRADTTRYFRVFAPQSSNEVGISQRHSGVWDDTKARISATRNGGGVIAGAYQYGIQIDGLQIENLSPTGSMGIYFWNTFRGARFKITNNIVRLPNGGMAGINPNSSDYVDIIAANNIVIGGDVGIYLGAAGTNEHTRKLVAHNNTVVNTVVTGIDIDGLTEDVVSVRNNLVVKTSGNDYVDSSLAATEVFSNNLSSDATAPGASFVHNATGISFVNAAIEDFRLSAEDSVAKDLGADLSADSNFAHTLDIVGNTRGAGGAWDIGAHETAVQIFRSVGPSNSTALARGSGGGSPIGNMTIVNGVATFASALPNNVGVGDGIEYDSNASGTFTAGEVLFIHKRNSSTQFDVRLAAGTKPSDVVTNNWNMYRAYTSIYDADRGIENTSFTNALENFDVWNSSDGRDIKANNEQFNFALFADAPDVQGGSGVSISGWITSDVNYLRFYTPHLSSEVGVSQRHTGFWSTSAYNWVCNTCGGGQTKFGTGDNYVRIDGMQFQITSPNAQPIYANATNHGVQFTNNIVRMSGAWTVATQWFWASATTTTGYLIANNIFYADSTFSNTSVVECLDLSDTGKIFVYNNTVVGCPAISYSVSTPDVIALNNISQSSSGNSYAGTFNADSTNNISDDASRPTTDVSNQQNINDVAFVDVSSNDYRLALADVRAQNAGFDLSTDTNFPFDKDLAGLSRAVPWDIGASNAVADYPNVNGLIAMWSLNENPANNGASIVDSLTGVHNGSMTTDNGAADKGVAGVVGRAIAFDGTSDIIDIPDHNNFDFAAGSDFSVALWYKSSQPPADYYEFMGRGTFGFETYPFASGGVMFGVSDSNANSVQAHTGVDINDGNWHHLVGVKSGNTVQLYKNGVLMQSSPMVFTGNFAGATPIGIGYNSAWGPADAAVTLDEASIWGRALSLTEIQQIFNDQRENIQPTINIGDVTVTEGFVVQAVVTLDSAVSWPVTFNWATQDGSATVAGSDYTAVGTTAATIPAGQTVLTLPAVFTNDDSPLQEQNEYFTIEISAFDGAQVGDIVGNVTLIDSDSSSLYTNWNGMISRWPMDEASGNIIDYGGVNDGVPVNSPVYSQVGIIADAIRFDGNAQDDYFNVGADASLNVFGPNQDFSIVLWVKPDNSSSVDDMYFACGSSSANGILLANNSSTGDQLTFQSKGNTIDVSSSSGSVTGTNWMQLAVTADRDGLMNFYVNGINVGSANISATAAENWNRADSVCKIGTDRSLSDHFDGLMDEVTLWNRALTPQEIETAYYNQSGAVKPIYRSVGPGNTGILAQGGANALSINSGIATFASVDIPNNVGVGDVIYYDDNNDNTRDTVVFIHARTDARNYTVRTAAGTIPANMAIADQDWRIYRAYTSLAFAEAGTENTGIGVNFDTWSNGRDIVANNEQWNIALYADALDTTKVTVDDWTTSVSNSIKIYTPTLTSEVGVSQRHAGVWTTSGYRQESNSYNNFEVFDDFVRVEGLQISSTYTIGGSAVATAELLSAGGYVEFVSNIIRSNEAGSNQLYGLSKWDATGELRAWNNIIYDVDNTGSYGIYMSGGSGVFYNNTIVNSPYGIRVGGGTGVVKNNIVQGATTSAYVCSATCTGSDYNLGNDANTLGVGSNNRTNAIVLFIDAINKDFRLASTDTEARNYGANLNPDPSGFLSFSTDILGATRTGVWDIGASEAATPIYRSVGPSNTNIIWCGGGTFGGCTNPHPNLDLIIDAANSTAYFASPVGENVGVGDLIVYDCGNNYSYSSANCVVYISGRTDSQNFTVKSVSGGLPPASYGADGWWRIYRAHTSLANAESGIVNSAVTTLLGAAHSGLDQWSGGRDLVANSEQWNIALYADAVDTADTNINGWATSAINYLKLFTPVRSNEVGVSQRHLGVLGYGYQRSGDIDTFASYVQIDGISVSRSANGPAVETDTTATSEFSLSNSLVIHSGNYEAFYVDNPTAPSVVKLSNNILVNSGAYYAARIQGGNSTGYIYNNTFIANSNYGFVAASGASAHLKNNIGYSVSGLAFDNDFITNQNNASDDATADDSGGTNNRINQTFGFNNFANQDYRITASDAGARNFGLNLSADANIAFNTDILGITRGTDGTWDIGASEAVTPIYRSVGPGNTTALSSGGGSVSLTISGSTATFASSRPNNIGVGDAIVYNGSANIAFISGRTSSTVYNVKSASGAAPTAVAGDTGWAIYRAYTSLANAETGIENTGIPAGVRDFDNWQAAGGRDLVANNEQWNIALYADAADTGALTVQGWASNQLNHLKIFAPSLSSEVGHSQRHTGAWDNTKARLVSSETNLFLNQIAALVIDGLQIRNTQTAIANSSTVIMGNGSAEYIVLKNSIVVGANSTGTNNIGVVVGNMGTVPKFHIINNIIYGYAGHANNSCISMYADNAKFYVYNNTVVDCGFGILSDDGFTTANVSLKNNIAVDSVTDDYVLNPAGAVGNLSSDTTSPNAALRSQTVEFINKVNKDFRLSAFDVAAKNLGTNLSADTNFAFNTDIAGNTRNTGGAWDIGAHESASAIYRSVGPANTSTLACGTTGGDCTGQGNLTISGSTATFASAVPNNIGVGDVIGYDCNYNLSITAADCVAFIHGRTSDTVFTVKNASGGTPTAFAAHNYWGVYRAYTSLADAESGIENSTFVAIEPTLANFDTWQAAGKRDLVTNNEQWNIALYGDAADTSSTSFDWTTSASNYLRVYAPDSVSEVGVSQRHNGKWDDTKARLVFAGGISSGPLFAMVSGVRLDIRFEGLQIKNNGTATFDTGLIIRAENGSEVFVLGNLFERTITGASSSNALEGELGETANKLVVANNIISGPWYRGAWIGVLGTGGSANEFVVYNNTIVGAVDRNLNLGSWNGSSNNKMYAFNNLVQGSATNYTTNNGNFTTGVWSLSNNLSFDATSPNAALQNKTVGFVNSDGGDYRLSLADLNAKDQGADLSNDVHYSFTADVKNKTRTATWDIGADEAVGNDILLYELHITDNTTDGFDVNARSEGDLDTDATATLFYCNATDSSNCDPLTAGISEPMGFGLGGFSVSVTGLASPNDVGDVLNLAVVANDPDGEFGSPLYGSVQLLPQIYLDDEEVIVLEGTGTQIKVYTSVPAPYPIVFDYSTGDATALAASDYVATVGRATIPTGASEILLPQILVNNDGVAETTEYFTVTLFNLQKASAGGLIVTPITVIDSTDGLQIEKLRFSNTTTTGYEATIDFKGDTNNNSVVTLWVCNGTDTAFCDPQTDGTSYVMSRAGSTYTYTVSGLSTPNDPGDFMIAEVIATDSSGVIGSPLNGTVTLLTANALELLGLSAYNAISNGFDASVNYNGDGDNDGSVELFYCNLTDDPYCTPNISLGVMTRSFPNFNLTVSGLGGANNPGDTLLLSAEGTDVGDGVFGSPREKTITLQLTDDPYYPNLSNLIFRFSLDDATQEHNSSIADSGPYNNDATMETNDGTNSKRVAQAMLGAGTDFDGVDDAIFFPYDASIDRGTGNFSMGAWVKVEDDCASTCTILELYVANGSTSNLIQDSSGQLAYIVQDSDDVGNFAASGVSVSKNEWHYVVGVKENQSPATIKFYLDGVLLGEQSQTYTGNFDFGAGSSRSIGYSLANNTFFDGQLDEATFWGRALSASEIEEIYFRQAPKKIFRSVGPGNTLPLVRGSEPMNDMEIMGDIATFDLPLPDNVGVGDAIVYGGFFDLEGDKIVFITKRISSTSFRVRKANLDIPEAFTSSFAWSAYRAYTSLYDAERGVENVGIAEAVRNFDTWSGGRDLVANNEQWNMVMYGDAPDPTTVTISGWTTDSARYMKIFSPSLANEVGISQRHRGTYDSTKARSEVTTANAHNINIDGANFVRVEGIQFMLSGCTAASDCENILGTNNANANFDIHIAKNLFSRGNNNAVTANTVGVGNLNSDSTSGKYKVYNNIFYASAYPAYFDDSQVYFYNNTLIGGGSNGVACYLTSTCFFKNNIVATIGSNCFTGNIGGGSNYNICNVGDTSGGAQDKQSVLPTFMDVFNGDVRLASADSEAKNYCTSLATDAVLSFTDDIAGNIRSAQGAQWDCGAFEVPEYLFTDNDHTNSEFDAGSKSNTEWATTHLQMLSTTASQRELSGPADTFGFDLTGIFAIWNFNDATLNNGATVADGDGGSANDGTLTTNNGGATKIVAGKLNNALDFDGAGDYMTVTYTTPVNVNSTDITFTSWIRPGSFSDWQNFFNIQTAASGEKLIFNTDANGYLAMGWGTVDGVTFHAYADSQANVLTLNQWYHVTAVYNGSGSGTVSQRMKIYVNGNELDLIRYDNSTPSNITPTNIWLGVDRYWMNSYYDGAMDATALYQRALSSDEIRELYNRQKGSFNNWDVSTFTSRVIDSTDADAKWYDLIPKSPVPYGRALPTSGSEVTSGYSGGVDSADILAYWRMDNKNAIHNATESAAFGGTTGTLSTGDAAVSKSRVGQFDGGISFDGVDDYLSVADNAMYSFARNQPRSWSFWIKPSSGSLVSDTYAKVVLSLYSSANDYFEVQIGSPTFSSWGPCSHCITAGIERTGGNYIVAHSASNVITEGQFYFVTVTYDGTNGTQSARFKIYVNGVDVTDTSDVAVAGTMGTGTFNPTSIQLGGQPAWPSYLPAELDEVAYWNKVLSATEAQNLYARGAARMKYQVRTCNDGVCLGESWRGYDNQTTSYFSELLNSLRAVFSAVLPIGYDVNRYLQYRVEFESDDSTVTPRLEQVDVRAADQ